MTLYSVPRLAHPFTGYDELWTALHVFLRVPSAMFDMLKAAVSNKHTLHTIAKSQNVPTCDSQHKTVSQMKAMTVLVPMPHLMAVCGCDFTFCSSQFCSHRCPTSSIARVAVCQQRLWHWQFLRVQNNQQRHSVLGSYGSNLQRHPKSESAHDEPMML